MKYWSWSGPARNLAFNKLFHVALHRKRIAPDLVKNAVNEDSSQLTLFFARTLFITGQYTLFQFQVCSAGTNLYLSDTGLTKRIVLRVEVKGLIKDHTDRSSNRDLFFQRPSWWR